MRETLKAATTLAIVVTLVALFAFPPLAFVAILRVPRLFAATAETTPPIKDQMAATRATMGWHVFGGELFHDGKRDEEGTARMQDEIAAINMRQLQADDVVDQWAITRKDALAASFQAQRNAVYGSYEAHRP